MLNYRLITLFMLAGIARPALAQTPSYGQNKEAGHYLNTRGFSLYYETYGQGQPLLFIHGDKDNAVKVMRSSVLVGATNCTSAMSWAAQAALISTASSGGRPGNTLAAHPGVAEETMHQLIS